MHAPSGDTWVGLTDEPLPIATATDWVVRPDCGALVVFAGTARDHAPGRPNVTRLEYEAYEEQVVPRLASIAAEARSRWPTIGRMAILHRVGEVAIGEASVVVAVSSPHRPESFDAARFAIEAVKASVPIWKRETWAGGDDWALEGRRPVEASEVGG
ncbi:MAG: molybdenum cofactor biosynthesis protein MoaE [Acidimicrobiales bacterium]